MRTGLVLPSSFAWQSTLTRRNQTRAVITLVAVITIGFLVAASAEGGAGLAFGMGLMAPGAGFAAPMLTNGPDGATLLLTLCAAAAFGGAMLLWFGTGNVLAPPAVWLGSAIVAAWFADAGPASAPAGALLATAAAMPLALLATAALARRAPRRAAVTAPLVAPARLEELDLPTLQLQRLLLDRALQPVDRFDGFEWRDQFQTAAVRYQLAFTSYALSLAHAHQLPAFTGYMAEAQRRLLAKQADPRMWRYWRLESAWGHLRPAADPVPRDNIMYSGFVAAQMALSGEAGPLRLALPGRREVTYGPGDLTRILADQYRRSRWGLLACEPGWIDPLCNLITGCGLRSADPCAWAEVEDGFREGLLSEFTTPDGRLVPFRCSLTGLALPAMGGAVMQAFPCLFLNPQFPDLAREHWGRTRERLAAGRWSRAFWPIDVGNYGVSRASSLAASAAAAVEMGDGDSAIAILAMLDAECPAVLAECVRHRPRASLWAHALELAARCNRPNGLARLVRNGRAAEGPHLADAPYPAVLVARAVTEDGRLSLVLHPGGAPGGVRIGLGGLMPGRHYRIEGGASAFLRADANGAADLTPTLAGRTELTVTPVI